MFKSLPNVKSLNGSKVKSFADNKINVNEKLKCWFEKGRKHCGKGENAGYQCFLLFLQCFLKPSISGLVKVGIVVKSSRKSSSTKKI